MKDESQTTTTRISVRSLVESVLVMGDLSQSRGYERMLEGMIGHKRLQGAYQKAASGGLQPKNEAIQSLQTLCNGISLQVHGRIDVLWMQDDLPRCIEEIKTTHRDPTSIDPDAYPLHWAQAECYAHMVCAKYGLTGIDVKLTYALVDGSATQRLVRTMQAHTLQERFQALVEVYTARLSSQITWQSLRDASLGALPFPFTSFRKGQRDMAAKAYRAARDGSRLLCQAPTGIGKTAAMLFSVLKAMGEGHTDKIFYLTARGTTQLAAEQGIALLRERGLRARSITLVAKEKLCAHPGCVCLPEECPRAKGHYDRLTCAIEEALLQREDYDVGFLRTHCLQHMICPFEFSLDLSLSCDVVIGDYNYAFDPNVRLRRYFMEKSTATLLIDEAHNLPDRARTMFSASLAVTDLRALRRRVGDISRRDVLYKALTNMIHAIKELLAPGERIQPEIPDQLLTYAQEALPLMQERLSENTPYHPELLAQYFLLASFVFVAATAKEHPSIYTTLCKSPGIELACLHPAPLLHATYRLVRSVILFSATLTPLSYFQEVCGVGEDADLLSLPSPFLQDNLLVLSHDLPTRYKQRESSAHAVAASIAALCGALPDGNYLLFFPSYAYMQSILPLVASRLPTARILPQTSFMKDADRTAFLAEFHEHPKGQMLAFAVMGGVFGEGIDLPGGRLCGCVVVGVGLPQICLERNALLSYYQEQGNDGFAYAYTYPGIARVTQAAGRLIRRMDDRGVVLLIDDRFSMDEYRELLPEHWQIQSVHSADAIASYVDDFWGQR